MRWNSHLYPFLLTLTVIHGITDEMVAGKRIDDQKVEEMLLGRPLLSRITHSLDLSFFEKRLPIFSWCPGVLSVPWAEEGYGSAAGLHTQLHGIFPRSPSRRGRLPGFVEVLQFPPVSGITVLSTCWTPNQLSVGWWNSPFG